MTIFLTDYNPDTLACTSVSADSGFSTFDEVLQLMGEPQMSHARMLTYPGGVCFTDFALRIDAAVTLCNTAPNTVQSNE